MRALDRILKRQRKWAVDQKKLVSESNPDYLESMGENLFISPTPERMAALADGSGRRGTRLLPDVCALRSSTALCVNVFEYWGQRQPQVIGACFGAPGAQDLTYEAKFKKPSGVGGSPPNLDAKLSPPVVTFETKFCEPYDPPKERDLRPVYRDGSVFHDLGLQRCAALARRLAERPTKTRLDAPQLLKHALGLKNELRSTDFTLIYLWFQEPGSEADQHAEELEDFTRAVSGDFELKAVTFQEVHASLAPQRPSHPAYFAYLDARYF